MRISEIFLSIQGEGVEIGTPTVFVRLYGCDLRCKWCDTMYAVEGGDYENLGVAEVLERVESFGCKSVCITGGEPLLQKNEVVHLAENLHVKGYKIVLETSGHLAPPGIFHEARCVISLDCKCPGSGMEKRMDFTIISTLETKDQLKFVLTSDKDYGYAKGVLKKYPTRAQVVFQPTGDLDIMWLAEMVLEDRLDGVRVLPQLHKLIWGEKRGV